MTEGESPETLFKNIGTLKNVKNQLNQNLAAKTESINVNAAKFSAATQKISSISDNLPAVKSAIGLSITPFLITFSSIGILGFMSSPYLYIGTILSIASLVGAVIIFVKKQKEEIENDRELDTAEAERLQADKDIRELNQEQENIKGTLASVNPQLNQNVQKAQTILGHLEAHKSVIESAFIPLEQKGTGRNAVWVHPDTGKQMGAKAIKSWREKTYNEELKAKKVDMNIVQKYAPGSLPNYQSYAKAQGDPDLAVGIGRRIRKLQEMAKIRPNV